MTQNIRFPLMVGGVGLGLGVAGNLLFYGTPPGISIPIFVLLLTAGMLGLIVVEGQEFFWQNLWLVFPALFLAGMSAVRAAPLLRFLNIAGSFTLLLLIASGLTRERIARFNLGEYLAALLIGGALALFKPFPLIAEIWDAYRAGDKDSRQLSRRVAIGLLAALPFLCVFTVLLASADLIFGGMVTDALNAFNLPEIIGRGLLTILLTWLAVGLLALTLNGIVLTRRETLPENEGGEAAKPRFSAPFRGLFGMVESGIVLFSVDVLFVVFVVIQFAALFGGMAFLEARGLTYSQYARRGFFELVTVAVIVLSLLLVLEHLTARKEGKTRFLFVLGAGLMLGLTVIMLASAFYRMALYEQAFGFTRLRLHTHIFMVWLAVLLLYFQVVLAVEKPRAFATGALLVLLGFIGTLNAINPDAFITRQNLIRYTQGEALDIDYLGSLSADAVPLLLPVLTGEGPRYAVLDAEGRERLGGWMHRHLDDMEYRQVNASWGSYHLSLTRAYRLLNAERELVETFEPLFRYYSQGDLYLESETYEREGTITR